MLHSLFYNALPEGDGNARFSPSVSSADPSPAAPCSRTSNTPHGMAFSKFGLPKTEGIGHMAFIAMASNHKCCWVVDR